jgi:ORF6N domain
MAEAAKVITVPDEVIVNKIYLVRGQKVMIDRDLAELYGVETKVLKQAVRRNIARFPRDFLFEMDKREFEDWRTQNRPPKQTRKVCGTRLFVLPSRVLRCCPVS